MFTFDRSRPGSLASVPVTRVRMRPSQPLNPTSTPVARMTSTKAPSPPPPSRRSSTTTSLFGQFAVHPSSSPSSYSPIYSYATGNWLGHLLFSFLVRSCSSLLCTQYTSNSTFCVTSVLTNVQAASSKNISVTDVEMLLTQGPSAVPALASVPSVSLHYPGDDSSLPVGWFVLHINIFVWRAPTVPTVATPCSLKPPPSSHLEPLPMPPRPQATLLPSVVPPSPMVNCLPPSRWPVQVPQRLRTVELPKTLLVLRLHSRCLLWHQLSWFKDHPKLWRTKPGSLLFFLARMVVFRNQAN